MATFVDNQLAKLTAREARVNNFYSDCIDVFGSFGLGNIHHLDIYWDGSFVRVIATDAKLDSEPLSEKLKYYNQGLGLMKIVMNKYLYP
jgi:hypothetical protein